jgi:hypothetical protein
MKKPREWIAQGLWASPPFTMDGHQQRKWQDDQSMQWPKTLQQALHSLRQMRLKEIQLRGDKAIELRLRNIATGEIRTVQWTGAQNFLSRYENDPSPTLTMPTHPVVLKDEWENWA